MADFQFPQCHNVRRYKLAAVSIEGPQAIVRGLQKSVDTKSIAATCGEHTTSDGHSQIPGTSHSLLTDLDAYAVA